MSTSGHRREIALRKAVNAAVIGSTSCPTHS